jgi:hypothetical protein
VAPRFSRPRLIDADDKQYRAFLKQIMISKDNQRAIRPPRARDLFGGEAEEALRTWLSERYELSDRRIIEYLEHKGRSGVKKYRELDAVAMPDAKTIYAFEFKASRKAGSLRRASQQLRDTRTILKMLFHNVHTTILLVDTGIPDAAEVAEIMAAEDAPPVAPPTLAEMLEQLPHLRLIESLDQSDPNPEVVNLMLFSIDDIIAIAGEENLHLDWDEEEEELIEEEPEPVEEKPRFAYSTDEASEETEESDEDNPFAAALRKAMKGRD